MIKKEQHEDQFAISYDQCNPLQNFEQHDFLTLYKGLAHSIHYKITKNNKNFRKLYSLCKPDDDAAELDSSLQH